MKNNKGKNEEIKKYSPQSIAKINERAYFIWLKNQKPQGSSLSDWLTAEKELKKEGKI